MTKIGIFTNDQYGPFQSLVIAGASAVAEQQGVEVVLHDTTLHGVPDSRVFVKDQVNGVVVIANAAPPQVLAWLNARGVAMSLISHEVRNPSVPSVRFDNAQGLALLVSELVDRCERRRLVFIRGIGEQSDARERESAFVREVMKRAPLTYPPILTAGLFDPAVAVESMRVLVDSGRAFDGVICADYHMAGAVIGFLRERGIDVPGQVAVAGFGDSSIAEAAGITTVSGNVSEIGSRAMLQVLHRIKGHAIRGVTTLSVELRARESTRGRG